MHAIPIMKYFSIIKTVTCSKHQLKEYQDWQTPEDQMLKPTLISNILKKDKRKASNVHVEWQNKIKSFCRNTSAHLVKRFQAKDVSENSRYH